MTKVIASLSLLAAVLIGGAFQLYEQFVPQPVANSVIAEKPSKAVGNQVAQVLPASMTEKQHRLLNMAYEVGRSNGLQPEIVQAILLQETKAGGMSSYKVANAGPEAYFGPMQIKLAAARDVLAAWPSLFNTFGFHTRTDDEVKANLILNERFNLEVGAKYLVILKKRYGLTGRDLMNAYNRGPGGVKQVDASEFHYAIGAEQKLATWKAKR